MIIGISGQMQSGKDTVGDIIQFLTYCKEENTMFAYSTWKMMDNKRLYWATKRFAHKVKEIATILTGIPVKHWEDPSVKEQFLPEMWNTGEKRLTGRELLQIIGTDAMRNNVHKNVWVNALFTDYRAWKRWIITDVRFPNEADAIKQREGILIRVNRGTSISKHESEIALDNYEHFDHIIDNNGTFEDLIRNVTDVMDEINFLV